MNFIFIDVEIYVNYFLLSSYNPTSGKINHFELHDDLDENEIKTVRKQMFYFMSKATTVSFNGLSFDLPIIQSAINGKAVSELKALADEIITSNNPSWLICKQRNISVPTNWNHIDLIEVAPGKSSLKIYGGRIHAPTIQDLPIEPNAIITKHQRATLRDYCVNDLKTTHLLYKSLEKQIDLRAQMSKEYDLDLRSKSDAQIAEAVIKSELKKKTGKNYYKPDLPDNVTFNYRNPKIITFKTEQLKAIFKTILSTNFKLKTNGAVEMPGTLAKAKIKIGNSVYNMGIGGLHSCEQSQYVRADENYLLFDYDVASYYPSIILQQNLAPKSMGKPFLNVYQSIVERRLTAKKQGDKVTADTLKICVNGSFGKLGSKWSALFAPDLLIQTTITGQLALLMLIERLELAGISVISANTDGIVIRCPNNVVDIDLMRNICFDWFLDTSYELEETQYNCIASRDVNNYIAVTKDGKIKRKGVFAIGGLAKNPSNNIAYTAVAEFLANGTSISQTIKNCRDLTQFVTVRKVTGGAIWCGEDLGKAVRFYYSNAIDNDTCIHYIKNSNKVPSSDGVRPCMTFPDTFPTDIDYDRYVSIAEKLLKDVGYA